MSWDLLIKHWALALAGLIGLLVVMASAVHLLRRSAGGQLRRVRADLARARQEQRAAAARIQKAGQRVQKLLARKDHVKPRLLQEASEALEDARSLAKIADDKVMIAENHVRRVIVEEFPPKKHERMRRKFLSGQQQGR